MSKHFLSTAAVLILLGANIHAEELNVEKPKETTHERGYHFKGLKEGEEDPTERKTEKQLLAELVDIAKKQLETQRKILDAVEQIRNPKPETIVVNGKECVANSTPECFQMPLVPKAKEIPVYQNWLREPNEENTLALVQWESVYTNKISQTAHMRDFVITKYGSKALETNFNRSTFDGNTGSEYKVVRKKNNQYVLNNVANKQFEIVIYLGKSAELDYQSFHNYSKNLKELKDVTYHVVFYTQGAKEAWEDSAKVFPEMKEILSGAKTIKVNKALFGEKSIYATPTLAVKIKKTGEEEPIAVGNIFASGIQNKILKMLEIKKVIKEGHSPDYMMFERVGTTGTDYVSHYYGKDLNMTAIKKLYKKGE